MNNYGRENQNKWKKLSNEANELIIRLRWKSLTKKQLLIKVRERKTNMMLKALFWGATEQQNYLKYLKLFDEIIEFCEGK